VICAGRLLLQLLADSHPLVYTPCFDFAVSGAPPSKHGIMHHACVGSDPEQGILLRWALMYCVKLLPRDYQYNLVRKNSTRPSLRHWDNQQSTTVHVCL
jgi:hypothetical protein